MNARYAAISKAMFERHHRVLAVLIGFHDNEELALDYGSRVTSINGIPFLYYGGERTYILSTTDGLEPMLEVIP